MKLKPSISSRSGTGATVSQALTAKMAVILDNYPEERLSEWQSKKVQMAVMGEIWKYQPGTVPQFQNSYGEKGVAYFTCGNEKSKVMAGGDYFTDKGREGRGPKSRSGKEHCQNSQSRYLKLPRNPERKTNDTGMMSDFKQESTQGNNLCLEQ